jgi:flagellar basal body-associated protein FliL
VTRQSVRLACEHCASKGVVAVDLVVTILAVALVLLAAAFILVVRVLLRRIDAAEVRAQRAEERAERAPKLSRAVNMGKIGEQFAPLLGRVPPLV